MLQELTMEGSETALPQAHICELSDAEIDAVSGGGAVDAAGVGVAAAGFVAAIALGTLAGGPIGFAVGFGFGAAGLFFASFSFAESQVGGGAPLVRQF